jgi:hypothetical protein
MEPITAPSNPGDGVLFVDGASELVKAVVCEDVCEDV